MLAAFSVQMVMLSGNVSPRSLNACHISLGRTDDCVPSTAEAPQQVTNEFCW